MKTKILVFAMLVSAGITMASEKSEKFKVYGNCGMCEERIEAAAKEVKGVTAADWNKETKMIEVSFDESKTDVHKVHIAIANAGHDTNMHKANDEDYAKLHGCCQYERAQKIQQKGGTHQGHKHEEEHSSCTMPKKASASGSCCGK
ncbi:heavy-metal-associated domain-containing protein [Carboxylicivirga sp. N1Y90]|uniref:heavy-metal-associated domain-containing protein n=1 Tax=Carboxylicivirga fragile TaxID=3417571 RepID=UPI003D353577|nr:cation transporter [Marinilabiliaceae bacterium N1Y90]